jgi:Gas vesicle synthesis protein GvpL/GvpF
MSESRAPSSYVYGIVPGDAPPAPSRGGVAEADELRTVAFERVAAIVSTVPTVPVKGTRANLMAHSDVLQEAVQASTVLPMRFGFVMADDDAVREQLLKPRHDELEGLLQKMAGRVEMGVKAYYLEDALLTSILSENRDIADLREATRKLPGEAGYYQRIRLGELIVSAIDRRRRRDSAQILRRLDELAVDHVLQEEIPERMVLKASVLVERQRAPALQQLIAELAEQHGRWMQFTCVGPLPPYSFVQLAAHPQAATGRG